MEEAAFDPELSRDLIKLLNSKVKDLSKALEDAKTENEALRQVKVEETGTSLGNEDTKVASNVTQCLRESMERVQKQLDEQVDAKQAVDAELTRTKEELERCKRELGYSTSMIKLHRNDNDELQADLADLRVHVEFCAGQLDESDNESSCAQDDGYTCSNCGSHHDDDDGDMEDTYHENDDASATSDIPDNVPCMSHGRTPYNLPAYIQNLSTASGRVIFRPGHTKWPYSRDSEGDDARVYTLLSKCDTYKSPFCWTRVEDYHSTFAGKTHELFYFSTRTSGVLYAGTFRCVRSGRLSVDDFRSFSPRRKDALFDEAVGGVERFDALHKKDQDRIRNKFYCGQAILEYIDLEFVEFNDRYFDAIMSLKKTDSEKMHGMKRKYEQQGGRDAKRVRWS